MAYFMTSVARESLVKTIPPLENGDRLDQKTFHERYEAMPEDFRAELIGGIVYMASPQKLPHGRASKLVSAWMDRYEEATPGTETLPAVTNILGPQSEPEPDNWLRILPTFGGHAREDKGYLVAAPELIAEIASTTE